MHGQKTPKNIDITDIKQECERLQEKIKMSIDSIIRDLYVKEPQKENIGNKNDNNRKIKQSQNSLQK